MVRTQRVGRGPSAALLRQVSLSVAATLIASAIVTGVQSEWTLFQPRVVSTPTLTSGGKFAARVELLAMEDNGAAMPLPTIHAALPIVEVARIDDRLRTADAVPSLPLAPIKPAFEVARAKRMLRLDNRRHPLDTAALLPPRRADFVSQAAAHSQPLQVGDAGSTGLWSTTKGLLRQTVSLAATMLDRVTPSSMIP